MQDCWLYEPQYRPDFTAIANKLSAMLEESAKQVSETRIEFNKFMKKNLFLIFYRISF
jgi:hypothetical protein